MDIAHIDWIPEGTHFGADEMTYFVGRGERYHLLRHAPPQAHDIP